LHAAVAAFLLVLVWMAIGTGLRAVFTSILGGPGMLFTIAIVPATVALGAFSLTAWGTSQKLLDPRHARFFGGFAATVAMLVAASIVYSGGLGAWEGFARKMARHKAVYNQWNMGITSVVIAQFDPPGPRAEAIAARPTLVRDLPGNVFFVEETVQERAWLIRLFQVAALIAAWCAARRFDDPCSFAFGFVLTYFLAAPAYYYYIVLLLPFLFFAAHPDRLRGTLGLVYMFLFGALGFTFYFLWDQYFITYYWNSVLALGVAMAMIGSAFGRFTPWPAVAALPRRTR
jgi:hypothetical protein